MVTKEDIVQFIGKNDTRKNITTCVINDVIKQCGYPRSGDPEDKWFDFPDGEKKTDEKNKKRWDIKEGKTGIYVIKIKETHEIIYVGMSATCMQRRLYLHRNKLIGKYDNNVIGWSEYLEGKNPDIQNILFLKQHQYAYIEITPNATVAELKSIERILIGSPICNN